VFGPSAGGVVFGIATTVVKPPAAAARAPLAIVSFCAPPGSRRCTCISISPGATSSPAASITVPAESRGAAVLSEIRPSAICKSPTSSRPDAGSMMRPPRIKTEPCGEQFGAWRLTGSPAYELNFLRQAQDSVPRHVAQASALPNSLPRTSALLRFFRAGLPLFLRHLVNSSSAEIVVAVIGTQYWLKRQTAVRSSFARCFTTSPKTSALPRQK